MVTADTITSLVTVVLTYIAGMQMIIFLSQTTPPKLNCITAHLNNESCSITKIIFKNNFHFFIYSFSILYTWLTHLSFVEIEGVFKEYLRSIF